MKEGSAAQLEIGLLNYNKRENTPLQLWVKHVSLAYLITYSV